MRALCRRFNVSPNTGYKLLHRFRAMGEQGLQNRSHRPLHTPSKTSTLIEEAVVSTRTEHPLWGPRRIASELRKQGLVKIPAPSTIVAILSRRGCFRSDRLLSTVEWLSAAPNKQAAFLSRDRIPSIDRESDLPIVVQHLLSKRVLERRRAMVILASWRGVRQSLICKLLRLSPSTYRRCLRVFAEGGAAALFARKINPNRKFDNTAVKDALFTILHQPPSNFDINRTAWIMADLSRIMKKNGHPVSEDGNPENHKTSRIPVASSAYCSHLK